MQTTMRHLLVIGAIALLVAGQQSPALAGKIYPAWVIPDTVNVRSGPGTDRKLISHLSKGAKVYVTAFANNWCWAKLPTGKWGWISEPLLQFSAEKGRELAGSPAASSSPDTDAMPAWIKVPTVNVRSGPGTNYQKRGTLTRGDKVYVVEIRNDWRKCHTPGGYGWIRHDMLETNITRGQKLAATRSSTPAAASESPSQAGGTAKAYVTGGHVHLRSGPGTNYRIKAEVVEGQTVYITQTRGDWHKVTVHGGASGWIHSDLLKYEGGSHSSSASTPPASSGGTAKGYVRAGAVHLRSGPGTNYRIKAKVVEGQTLYITETRNDWFKVTVHGGDSGWIRRDLVKLENGSSSGGSSTGSTSRPAAPTTPTSRPSGSGRTLAGVHAWIAEDAVNVRYGPGTDQDVKTKLSKGAKVQVLELSGHWCKIKTDGGTVGWVAGWVMNFKGPGEDVIVKQNGEDIPVRAGWVARPEVNLRAGPGTDQKEIGETTLGTQVIILDKQGDWYKVALDNGATGWMADWLVDTREERRVRQGLDGGHASSGTAATTLSPASSIGRKAVDLAMNYLGCRYVHGTSGPRTFDCSGFTSFIYRQLGINISRSSRTQAYQGDLVPRDQLQVGDVIIFKNTYRAGPSHVGLYIGDGKFIHASNSRRGVVIDALSSSYYASRYHSARRVY